MLQQLLGYDPAEVPAGQLGYGSGSGKPDIMFGFVKHLWQCGDRHDALSRSGPVVSDTASLRALLHSITKAPDGHKVLIISVNRMFILTHSQLCQMHLCD